MTVRPESANCLNRKEAVMAASHITLGTPRLRRPQLAICNAQAVAAPWELAAGKLRRLDGDQRWEVIACRRGSLWITQANDPLDYLVGAGEMFVITQPGRVVIEALTAASVQLAPLLQTPPGPASGETVFA
jgi:hypothetical protein